ncbi:uncharacterized protein LOC141902690 isoform X2 [Tubulanus polymorphus]|uniref:uncharacterized protein LOC141902690 isoform X2 n=1 Tax=Tubulanus polymorphus TaxID=672921 RepID=UPI003DA677EC
MSKSAPNLALARKHYAAGARKIDRPFNVRIKLFTDEIFHIKEVTGDLKIRRLKSLIEFAAGIPYHLQKLHYLDEADLLDHMDLKQNDIVPGAILHLEVWSMWRNLVEAVAIGDSDWLFKLGVTKDTDYKTPTLDYMSQRSRDAWLAERAFIALFMASHRGNMKMVSKLVIAGVNLDAKTPLGRTALHVAASQGHGKVITYLLEKGANINEVDNDGNTALNIAGKYGHKGCERHLFLFQWQKRASNLTPEFLNPPLLAHQYFDSSTPVWLQGPQAQVYYSHILPPSEFESGALNAPRKPGYQRGPRPSSAPIERKKDKRENAKKTVDFNVQVQIGRETMLHALKEVRLQELEANQHKNYLKSLLAKSPPKKRSGSRVNIDDDETLGSGDGEGVGGGVDGVTGRTLAGLEPLPVDIEDLSEKAEEVLSQLNDGSAKSNRLRRFVFDEVYGFQRKNPPKTYREWLTVKRREEKQRMMQEKAILEEKCKINEEREVVEKPEEPTAENEPPPPPPKRVELAKKNSYESWMNQQQEKESSSKVAVTRFKDGGGTSAGDQPDDEQDVKSRIRTLLKTHADKQKTPYEEWLMKKELDQLDRIRQGKKDIYTF